MFSTISDKEFFDILSKLKKEDFRIVKVEPLRALCLFYVCLATVMISIITILIIWG